MEELNSIEKYRKQIKQEKIKRRVVAVLIIVTLALIVFSVNAIFKGMTKENQLPTYDEAELSEGFPITMPTSATYRLKLMGDDISLLTDTGIYVYNNSGDRILNYSHAYNSPVSETNNTRTLVYDAGGTQFMVSACKNIVFQNTVADKILSGEISDKGYTAIVVDSERYASILYVYNKSGKEIYSVSLTDKIISCDFLPDSSGCVVSTTSANGGQVYSKIICYKFNNSESSEWSCEIQDNIIMEINSHSDSSVTATGDNGIYQIKKGEIASKYEYKNSVFDYAESDNITAVLLDDSENRHKRLLVFDKNGELTGDAELNNDVKKIYINGSEIYALNGKTITEYEEDGTVLNSTELDAEYNYFDSNSKNFYLLSDTIIQKVSISSVSKNSSDSDVKADIQSEGN